LITQIIDWDKVSSEHIELCKKRLIKAYSKHKSYVTITYPKEVLPTENNPTEIHHNYPYIIIDMIKTDEEIIGLPGIFNFLLIKTIKEELRLNRKDTEPAILKNSQILKMFVSNNVSKDDRTFFVISIDDYMEKFNQILFLVGHQEVIHNKIAISRHVTDLVSNDLRFYVKFTLNLPSKLLICINQHGQAKV